MFANGVGFSNGWAEFALKNPPPFVPSCLIASWLATGPRAITAEAIWVGIGAGADFIGRDVKGKAVVIYSTFVPGGRSHSASDRAGLFNANARAVQLGAALVVNVMAVPGNGQFQPEGGLRDRHDAGTLGELDAVLIGQPR